MTVIVAGERSGVGKTTITLALLSSLCRQGYWVQSFKVGPDYIDPMFHTLVTGRPCRNLDPILTSEDYVRSCFAYHCQGVDYALIEGVMGLFDGVNDYANTAHIARLLDLQVILVIDCSRLSSSVAAIVHGYRSFDPRINLAGVVLNKVGSDRHLELLKSALQPLNVPIVGVLRREDTLTIPDRHLGLIPTTELTNLKKLFDKLAYLAQNCFNWNILLPLLRAQAFRPYIRAFRPYIRAFRPYISSSIKIAVAKDSAFNFYYHDNLEILEQLGAKLIFWSPISDQSLPKGVHGLYFGGGFPEVFAESLAENQATLQAVRVAIDSGMPIYAECGGLRYLCEGIIDFDGNYWKMVGMIPTNAKMSQQLTLGYRQATAFGDSFLLKAGENVCGHEFHRSCLTVLPELSLYKLKGFLANDAAVAEGWYGKHFHASYLHLHFGGCPIIAQRFFGHCLDFFKRVG